MPLTGIHLLLTYTCNYECDHCFVWGSPFNEGTMTLDVIRKILKDAKELGTVTTIYFEGGEPFLYYPIMLQGMREAVAAGFEVGIVTNTYWATSLEDAEEWLRPIAEIGVTDLSMSSDLYHGDRMETTEAQYGREAAANLGIPVTLLQTVGPILQAKSAPTLEDPEGGYGGVMFKGRAAEKLTPLAPKHRWTSFTSCPYEDFEAPGRVHIDPLGFIHGCQGITIGNILEKPLPQIMAAYNPRKHPIIGPLVEGGPVALVKAYDVPHAEEPAYADACHLCYQARKHLRPRFPELAPDQVYGLVSDR